MRFTGLAARLSLCEPDDAELNIRTRLLRSAPYRSIMPRISEESGAADSALGSADLSEDSNPSEWPACVMPCDAKPGKARKRLKATGADERRIDLEPEAINVRSLLRGARISVMREFRPESVSPVVAVGKPLRRESKLSLRMKRETERRTNR